MDRTSKPDIDRTEAAVKALLDALETINVVTERVVLQSVPVGKNGREGKDEICALRIVIPYTIESRYDK